MNVKISTLPKEPTNIIFTGIAGTGKTHQLLQIQSLYDEVIESSWGSWRLKQLKEYSWCDVICTVLLQEDRTMTVPEITAHPFIQDKAAANERDSNIHQTLWGQLNSHAHPDSTAVSSIKRSASYFFNKNEAGQWYLLDDVKSSLKHRLADLLSLYDMSTEHTQHSNQHTISRTCLVSFHQAYGYDEFVEGIRPQVNPTTGQMQYNIQAGAFLALCEQAAADSEHRYAMLIDEINRANTAQVFGELMSVIEPTKRANSPTPMAVRLAYSGRLFSVPDNVDIYATMNTQDYSLATLDTAFRRRFEFVNCAPDSSLLTTITDSNHETVALSKLMKVLNQRLAMQLGYESQLGHAYFMQIENIKQLANRLYKQIIPHIIHQFKINTANLDINNKLAQILYGGDNPVQENSLLHSPEQMSNVDNVNAGDVPLSSDFMKVIEEDNLINSDINHKNANGDATTDNSVNSVFLTAKPYQQMYEDSHYK